ncbi:MAG: glycosyltransferase family 9 protein, partial [Deltaproteobacteria bacterium]|nr:glycosyltransferase family 9 protein [Deltaproteobacteria bacterium]
MKEKRLLIIHHGALGDFVITFPAVIQLKKHYDRVDVLCQSKLGKLAQTLGIAHKWFPLEAASFSSLHSDRSDPRVKDLFQTYHDIILFSFSKELEAAIQRITDKKIHRISPRPHVSQKIHVAEHIFIHLADSGLLENGESARRRIPPLAADTGKPGNRTGNPKEILIHPGSGSKKKLWPIENFMEVIAMLRADGFRPEIILGPAEFHLEERRVQAGGPYGNVHLIEDLSALVLRLESAGGFIGNDSGVSHLAAFTGLPTIAVFGPSDPDKWKPAGPSVDVVRPVLECSPCF